MALKDSAIALVWRQRPGAQGTAGVELLWLQRGAALRFGAGFYAFPGGKLDAEDARVPVTGAEGEAAALRVCAVRECFEETGLLLARGAERLELGALAVLRAELAAGAAFGELLRREQLSIHAEDLREAGRWITPAFSPVRFDARMFLARAPQGQAVSLSAAEAAEGGFVHPSDALRRWREGRALLHPPNWNALVALDAVRGEADWPGALARLQTPPFTHDHLAFRIEFQEGIVMVPQVTPTLLPATHTNAYLLGTRDLVLVDPGADDEGELALLREVIAALASEGRTLRAIALTHHHFDHIGGVRKLQAELGLPLWAHAKAQAHLDAAGLPIDRRLADGEDLGLSGFPLTALHTPGHTRGHLAFVHPPSGAAIVGDLISGLSTIVIDPPEGDMTEYFASLERLLALRVTTLYPAHGMAIAGGEAKLSEYLAHRRAREAQVLEAVREGATSAAQVVPKVYAGTPEFLLPFAERSVQAHLDKLVAEHRLEVRDERYRSATP